MPRLWLQLPQNPAPLLLMQAPLKPLKNQLKKPLFHNQWRGIAPIKIRMLLVTLRQQSTPRKKSIRQRYLALRSKNLLRQLRHLKHFLGLVRQRKPMFQRVPRMCVLLDQCWINQ